MCYSCGGGFARVIPSNTEITYGSDYILYQCVISKENLCILFSFKGASNSIPVAILGKVYTVNSITLHTTKMIPIERRKFSGNLIFKKASSNRMIDFSNLFSLVEEK